ncbi:unnamed protein product [Merluccius merluccius]
MFPNYSAAFPTYPASLTSYPAKLPSCQALFLTCLAHWRALSLIGLHHRLAMQQSFHRSMEERQEAFLEGRPPLEGNRSFQPMSRPRGDDMWPILHPLNPD